MWDTAIAITPPVGSVRTLPSNTTLKNLQDVYNPSNSGIFINIGTMFDLGITTSPEPRVTTNSSHTLPEQHVLRKRNYQLTGNSPDGQPLGRPISCVVLQFWDGAGDGKPTTSAYAADIECALLWRQVHRPHSHTRVANQGIRAGTGNAAKPYGVLKLQTVYRALNAGRRSQVAATIARAVAPARVSAAVICPYMLQIVVPKRKYGWASVRIVPGGSVTLSLHRDQQTYVVTNLDLPRPRTCVKHCHPTACSLTADVILQMIGSLPRPCMILVLTLTVLPRCLAPVQCCHLS